MYKMIIADDEKIIRESIAELIDWELLNIEITSLCKNGLEALDAIVDTAPDIVITDIQMPGLNGLDLIEKMYHLDKNIYFIILTGYAEFEYAQRAISFGVKEYLLKPINEKVIIQAVEKAKEKFVPVIENTSASELCQNEKSEKNTLTDLVKQYVTENIGQESLSLKYIAENYLFVNVNYLSRTFHKQTGENFSNYLNRIRIEKAKDLLNSDKSNSIHYIAESIGFGNNPQYFSQVFKKFEGITPSQYTGSLTANSNL